MSSEYDSSIEALRKNGRVESGISSFLEGHAQILKKIAKDATGLEGLRSAINMKADEIIAKAGAVGLACYENTPGGPATPVASSTLSTSSSTSAPHTARHVAEADLPSKAHGHR